MSDNLQKLVGLLAMAVLVVLGVVLTNDDDTECLEHLEGAG